MNLNTRQHITILDTGENIFVYHGVGDTVETNPVQRTPVTDIHIPADTQLFYYLDWQNSSITRTLTLHLDAPGAHAQIIGKFSASKDHQIVLNSTIAHHAANTTGNCLIKGVLSGHAQASLSGMIQIDHLANNSYDQLTERLLVLSPHAIGQLKPELEILTNDVRASHATTVSRPDAEQLFYLQSRGLNTIIAQDLLVDGFLQEVLLQFPQSLHIQ